MRTSPVRARSVAVLTLLAVFASAPFALAQTPKKKKPKKPTTEAPAEPTPPPAPVETTPPPAPEPAPAPAPAPTTEAAATAAPNEEPGVAPNDPTEKPGQTYNFVGLRYRGTIIPKFMMNIFVDEGATVYSNSIGIEYEIRRDGFSMVPWLSYEEYGTGDILFHEKGKPLDPQNYSMINSSLKGIYVGADLRWSTEISNKVAIEYGAGAGIGFIFGDLVNNWVYGDDPNGPLVASTGAHYSPCPNTAKAPSCTSGLHSNADVAKVGGYVEPSWFSGGSRPSIFPHITLPEIGVRYKPIKQVALRASIGFSITGFFFGLTGSYGLPAKEASASKPEPKPEKTEKSDDESAE